jgi:cardiolipin synthase
LILIMKYYHLLLLIGNIIIALTAAWHALLFKRDPRASLGWIAVILIFPLIGPFLYFLFGINRIKTRAQKLTERSPLESLGFFDEEDALPVSIEDVSIPEKYSEPANISRSVTHRPLVGNNRLEILYNGEKAYPAMIRAIEEAEQNILLSTYIFDTDRTGRMFIDKLAVAVERGVDVKVILDGVGEYYSFPKAGSLLKKRGIKVARFLPPRLLPPAIHVNLRDHRKILVVDGHTGFVGGMNIGERHLAGNTANQSRVIDIHFQVQGPVVSQIQDVFTEDWNFITKDAYRPVVSDKNYSSSDGAICRVVTDGPNEDLDKLVIILMGAISSAKKRVLIMTPYFLPTRDIISALQTVSLKGVEVDILLPSKNNIPFLHWATRNMMWELLQRGVNIYYQPPPFVHTKLLVVDDYYAHIGTANMDSRSLRLNFELVVEVYDEVFVKSISEHILNCREQSRRISLKEIDSRNFLIRTRDSLAWLFYSYL